MYKMHCCSAAGMKVYLASRRHDSLMIQALSQSCILLLFVSVSVSTMACTYVSILFALQWMSTFVLKVNHPLTKLHVGKNQESVQHSPDSQMGAKPGLDMRLQEATLLT